MNDKLTVKKLLTHLKSHDSVCIRKDGTRYTMDAFRSIGSKNYDSDYRCTIGWCADMNAGDDFDWLVYVDQLDLFRFMPKAAEIQFYTYENSYQGLKDDHGIRNFELKARVTIRKPNGDLKSVTDHLFATQVIKQSCMHVAYVHAA